MSATAEVAAFLAAHEECFSNAYIGGRFVRAGGGATFSTISPTSERTIAEVPAGSRRDIEAAVAAARSAFDGSSWGTQPGCERAVCLRALAALVLAHKDILAKIESLDMGKHVDDAASDVDACCGILEEHAALAEGLDARQTVAVEGSELNRGYVRYEPYGVVAAITPWNYPLVCVVVKLAPALAAGNTLVVKPSEYTPLTSMFLCQLVHDAGFPPGVFNSVTGSGTAAGAPLAASPLIDMVSFTGSIRTGTAIMAAAARTVTKPLLELGGKSAAVIFEDIDVDEVVPWLMQGFCQNAGQVCVCHTRAIVHESVKDKLVAKLAAEVAAIPFALGARADVSICAAVLTGISLCNVCSCPDKY
jgi:betaine-aldehyde dehydrogenase